MSTRYPGERHSTPESIGVEEVREVTDTLGGLLLGITGVLVAALLAAVPAGGVPSGPLTGFAFGFLFVVFTSAIGVGAAWAAQVYPARFRRATETGGGALVAVYLSLGVVLTSALVFGVLPVAVPGSVLAVVYLLPTLTAVGVVARF